MQGIGIPIEALLGARNRGDEEDGMASLPIPEAQIMRLRELQAKHATACPFKPGDLVTPVKGARYLGAGQPFIVLEVLDPPVREWPEGESGSPEFGAAYDVRVLGFHARGGDVLPWMQESWMLEPYTGPGSELAPTSED